MPRTSLSLVTVIYCLTMAIVFWWQLRTQSISGALVLLEITFFVATCILIEYLLRWRQLFARVATALLILSLCVAIASLVSYAAFPSLLSALLGVNLAIWVVGSAVALVRR